MDSATYTELTGKTITVSQTARFDMQAEVAKKALERMLGYPLDPSDWGNQYIERGKTDGYFCDHIETEDLEAADAVEGTYRFFNWHPLDINLLIDPATAIHAVKLVQDDVTVKTLESVDYMPQWQNSEDGPFTRSLVMRRDCIGSVYGTCFQRYVGRTGSLLVAVDADWAFSDIPLELNQVWAALIGHGLDDKKDIRSESAGTHSYTRFSTTDPASIYTSVIERYAGPNRAGGDIGVA